MNNTKQSFSRRSKALLSLTAIALIIGLLIYFEQIAFLYVLATVSLVVLLLVVAFAPLEKVGADSAGGFSRE